MRGALVRRRAGLAAGAVVVLLAAGAATGAAAQLSDQELEDIAAVAGPEDLPAGCGYRWRDPNVRTRTINRDTYLHRMSDRCYPNGPVNGTVKQGSTWRVYFADPYQPSWCYGYSVNLARKGYILCDAMSIP